MSEPLIRIPAHRQHPSRSLRALEGVLATRAVSDEARLDPDLSRLTSALRALEGSSGQDVVTLLEDLAALAPPVDPGGRSALTAEQELVLRRTGSFVEEMPPAAARPSTATAVAHRDLLAASLTTAELARVLGVTPGRIRQRATARTLYGVLTPAGLRFPRFQLLDGAELPGWARVATRVPVDAHPVAVERLLSTPHVDLSTEDTAVSPIHWLAEGNPPERVADLVRQAFTTA